MYKNFFALSILGLTVAPAHADMVEDHGERLSLFGKMRDISTVIEQDGLERKDYEKVTENAIGQSIYSLFFNDINCTRYSNLDAHRSWLSHKVVAYSCSVSNSKGKDVKLNPLASRVLYDALADYSDLNEGENETQFNLKNVICHVMTHITSIEKRVNCLYYK